LSTAEIILDFPERCLTLKWHWQPRNAFNSARDGRSRGRRLWQKPQPAPASSTITGSTAQAHCSRGSPRVKPRELIRYFECWRGVTREKLINFYRHSPGTRVS